MSVIIGYKENDNVYLATDSNRSRGNYYYSDLTETGTNIFHLPYGVICGVSNYYAKQIIRAHEEWFASLSDEPLTKRFIMQNVIPKFYECLDREDMIEDANKGNSNFDGSVLLAQGDKLFCIDDDFGVLVIPKFCIIGDGADYAYARVVARKADENITDTLYHAISDANTYCRTVCAPYLFFSTKRPEKQLLEVKNADFKR